MPDLDTPYHEDHARDNTLNAGCHRCAPFFESRNPWGPAWQSHRANLGFAPEMAAAGGDDPSQSPSGRADLGRGVPKASSLAGSAKGHSFDWLTGSLRATSFWVTSVVAVVIALVGTLTLVALGRLKQKIN